MRYRDYGVDVDSQTAKLLLGALLSDTVNLNSSSTTTADREAFTALDKLADIDDIEGFYRDMYKASISYEGMSTEEILDSDVKQYESSGKTFSIACMSVYDEDEAAAMVERIKTEMPEQCEKLGVDMAFAQVSIFHDDISITYLVPSDEAAAEVIEMAFGDQAHFDGSSYVLNPGVSRKQVLVPAFTDVLAMHPTE